MAENTKTTILSNSYKYFAKPFLFLKDPEDVHDNITSFGRRLGGSETTRQLVKSLFNFEDVSLEQEVLGIRFKNPIGLSAGFDKDANLVNILDCVGFGFMQAGTVTDKPYIGNPKPRLYRLPDSKGLVVYYGLKNIGATKIIKRVKENKSVNFPISMSIGKTNCKETATDKSGIEDYYNCFKKVIKSDVGDFYTINISCPNTFGGEPFTTPARLKSLLNKLYTLEINKPVFIKMPINPPWKEFRKLLDVAVSFGVEGVIIGNLNKDRKDKAIKDTIPSNVKGSISGKPNKKLSNGLIEKTYKHYNDKFVIVGVGGVFSGKDAYEKIRKGATLVQLITGMIYEGPQLIGEINRDLVEFLKKDGYKHISEAVGADHKK